MTSLCELIMECQAIKGMDRLVLYGWAAQLEEGNDTLFCSKETVAESIGVSEDTVLRRTQALVKAEWIIETGEQKQWEFARTPVRIINVPVIMGLVEAQEKAPPQNAALPQARPQIAPPQNAAQGSSGSMVLGLGLLCSPSPCSAIATGVPPVVGKSLPPTNKLKPKTENLKTLKPTPTPTSRLCPKCGSPWSRYKGHLCQTVDPIDMDDGFEDGDWEPMGYGKDEGRGVGSKTMKDGASQKSAECVVEDKRATPFAQSPHSAAPPQDEFPDDIWDAQGRTKDTPAGRAWAASRGEEIIKPTSISS
jgi:hypothetical protein